VDLDRLLRLFSDGFN